MSTLLSWLNELYANWHKDRVASLSAALAYYAIFSLAPILVICISIVGMLFGENAARGEILEQARGLLGTQAALAVQDMIKNVNHPATALWTRVFSVVILIFSASGVFNEIQQGLNIIWGVKFDPNQKWFSSIKSQFLSFAMVLVSAFLLLVSLILTAFLTILSSRINYFIGANIYVELIISYCFSFLIITFLFAMMFKNLPDINLKWRNVWMGAVITSLLFSLGKIVIGFYLKHVQLASVFGAASSLIVLLIWVYYSAQIFFIGAEITKLYSTKKHY